ncbi:MAG TPA: hypothetical protein VF914_08975 [Chloroflexia bacterium]|jgi:hypothetical protein
MDVSGKEAKSTTPNATPSKVRCLSLFLLLALAVAGCSDKPGPDLVATQTAVTALNERVMARYNADATAQAAVPQATPVPTADTDACDLLTKEEVSAAVGKPMEPVTLPKSGRCIFQGESEFMLASVYTGMTEQDAKNLYNSKWTNPNIPNGIAGGGTNRYARARELTDLGDEAFLGETRPDDPTTRRAVFVRQGNKLFYLEWYTTVTDRDVSQAAIDLARKALPRL